MRDVFTMGARPIANLNSYALANHQILKLKTYSKVLLKVLVIMEIVWDSNSWGGSFL